MCVVYHFVHSYTVVCVFGCVSFSPAGGKQCGLSWGRSRLKVPGEDVILCDAAHRDRQTHKRLPHSLPHYLIQWILWSVAIYPSFCIVQLPFSDYICKSARLDGCAQDKSPEEQNGSQRQCTFPCDIIPSSWLLTQFSQRASIALSQGSTDTALLKHKSPQRHQPMLMRLKQKYNELRHSQTWGELMLRLHSGSG